MHRENHKRESFKSMTHQDSNKHQYPENKQYYQTKSIFFKNYEPSSNQTQNGYGNSKIELKNTCAKCI